MDEKGVEMGRGGKWREKKDEGKREERNEESNLLRAVDATTSWLLNHTPATMCSTSRANKRPQSGRPPIKTPPLVQHRHESAWPLVAVGGRWW